jgi:hypothetical protein
MSDAVQAWLLCVAPGVYTVLPRQAMGHLVDEFSVSHVPQAPRYANHVYLWKGQILPIFNLSALVLGERQAPALLGIVAYRYGGAVQQGAVALFAPPQLIDIPAEPTDWPEGGCPWSALADSCVKLPVYGACPILSTDKLFAYAP